MSRSRLPSLSLAAPTALAVALAAPGCALHHDSGGSSAGTQTRAATCPPPDTFDSALCVCDDFNHVGELNVVEGPAGVGAVGVNGFTRFVNQTRAAGSWIAYAGFDAVSDAAIEQDSVDRRRRVVGRCGVGGRRPVGGRRRPRGRPARGRRHSPGGGAGEPARSDPGGGARRRQPHGRAAVRLRPIDLLRRGRGGGRGPHRQRQRRRRLAHAPRHPGPERGGACHRQLLLRGRDHRGTDPLRHHRAGVAVRRRRPRRGRAFELPPRAGRDPRPVRGRRGPHGRGARRRRRRRPGRLPAVHRRQRSGHAVGRPAGLRGRHLRAPGDPGLRR